MTDHPLIPEQIQEYMQTQGLEAFINKGINKVIREMPADALSSLACYLIENAQKKAIFDSFIPQIALVTETTKTLQLQTLIDYEGKVKNRLNYNFTWNMEDYKGDASEEDTIAQMQERF